MPKAFVKFTADFLIEAYKRYRRQGRARFISLGIKLLALALLAPLTVWLFLQRHLLIGVFFVFVSIFMFYAHHVDYWLARRSFRRSPYRDEDVTLEFTEAAFRAKSAKQDVTLQWSVFTRVVHFDDGFLLFQGPKQFNWIPFSCLDNPSQVGELEALLRSKIVEHKVLGRV